MQRFWGVLCALTVAACAMVAVTPSANAATAGSVIRVEALPRLELPAAAARGVRLLYETRDQNGRPARSYGAVYYPRGSAPAGGWKVVSWAHGTSGIAEDCAPSRSAGSERDLLEPTIGAALKAGYVVVATDYIGLGGGSRPEYLGGRSEGHSVLDMVRAARHNDARISKAWVSLGHSQGGHAALWGAWLSHNYAPELDLRGTVPLAPASHIELMFSAFGPYIPANSTLNGFGGLGLYAINGLDAARPELKILDYLSPTGRALAQRVKSMCVFDLNRLFAHRPLGSLFAKPLANPAVSAALRDYMAVPTTGWTVPVRIQQGTSDETVFFPVTAALVAELKVGGAGVSLVPYSGANHMQVVPRSIGDTLATIAGYFHR
ncbi:lipase family protein [Gordonia sp. CPCC 205333]|uniref:lipase family protein n=1 Tax=Gordonia sp. CPCC 205333 TaxID=3140790 RepID=UPI003AF403F3